jgi:hypothetical protein
MVLGSMDRTRKGNQFRPFLQGEAADSNLLVKGQAVEHAMLDIDPYEVRLRGRNQLEK